MQKPTIGYVNVFVSNFQRALEFYRDQIGLDLKLSDDAFGSA